MSSAEVLRRGRKPRRNRVSRVRIGLGLSAVVVVGVLLTVGGNTGEPSVGAPPPTAAATPPATSAPVTPPTGVDVRTYGATGDGVTDDAPALRRALAENDGVHIPAGTYLLDSYSTPRTTVIDADFVVALRSGQTITADPGAILLMGDRVITASTAAWGGNVFLADHVTGIMIAGLTVDLNGAANLVPPGRTITGYGLYTYAANDVTLADVTMRNTPGQNYVVAQGGGEGFRVQDSTFRNGGTSIPGNVHQDDFSALYFTGKDVAVDGITIEHDKKPSGFSGGVELHGPLESVTNSEIHDSWPAVYIGPDTYSDLGRQHDISVRGNAFINGGRGVVFNALGTGDIDGVDIIDNEFRMSDFPAFTGEPVRAIDQDMPPDGNWTYHHLITGLVIRNNTFHGADTYSDGMIRLSQVHSADIRGNRMLGVAGTVFTLNSSPWDVTHVSFVDNEIIWARTGTSPVIALAFDDASTVPARSAFGANHITVAGNTVRLLESTGRSCGVYASWPDGSLVSSIQVRDNGFEGIEQDLCGPQAGEVSAGS